MGMDERGKSVLFISNGHGEDLIAARLARGLTKAAPSLGVLALPIVGTGAAYAEAGIPLIATGQTLPSGGFARQSLANLAADLRAGLFSLTLRQIRVLREAREGTDLAVCVGDSYLNLLAGNFLRRPIVFLPTAKSDYVQAHFSVEIGLMRRFCVKIFPRDALTARSLAGHGLPAEFAGNVMMDSLDFKGPDLHGSGSEWVIGVLPGSRWEAYDNMADIAGVAAALRELTNHAVRYLVALAGNLSFDAVAARLEPLGWAVRPPGEQELARGISGHLEAGAGEETVRFTVAQGRFADILAASDAVLGLAGTANEQAAGLGKPVVTFAGRGAQFTERFARVQRRLLGEAVSLVPGEPRVIAQELLDILTDENRREAMARVGRERMGGPGGAGRIVTEIRRLLQE